MLGVGDMLKRMIGCGCEDIAVVYRPVTFVLSVMCRSEVIEAMLMSEMVEAGQGK